MITYRWAQLDLARQMESIEFIKTFIRTMANAGYNGVELYLEDRIRTASYPYPADDECYTPEQMKDIIEYATSLNMELIPCVATLGHAERFLRHKELVHLSELQGDMQGRFGGSAKVTFCPTHPDFYPFITKYVQEVAAIFPSTFFHAGLDEFWDYCLCERCKKAAPTMKDQQDMFIKHIQIIRQTLADAGKRMLMWSDMFEYYPDAMPDVPKDIIMIDWQYQSDVRFYLHHLFDCKVESRFDINEKLGLETFIGPVDMLFHNAQSYLEYAAGKKFTGAILTSWEKTDAFLYRTLPTFVYGGLLMAGHTPEEATDLMMEQLFGTKDIVLASAIKLALTNGPWRHFKSISNDILFSRDFTGLPYTTYEIDYSVINFIKAQQHLVTTDLGKLIIRDILDAMNEKCISHDLAKFFHSIIDKRPVPDTFQSMRDRFAAYLDTMEAHWNELRPGITGNVFTKRRKELLDRLDANYKKLMNSKFVKLRLCLPDGYGIESVRVSLQYKENGPWEVICDRVLKQIELGTASFEHFLPYQSDAAPCAIKLEAYGMGGVGISYVEVDEQGPTALLSISGNVQNPGYLLSNDINFAWFGTQSTKDTYFNKAECDAIHQVTMKL